MRYLDTSALVGLYFPEAKTEALAAYLSQHPLPLAFTWLHEMEFTNGLELKRFRKEATAVAVAATLAALRADLQAGVLNRAPLPWPDVFASAVRLSLSHSARLGTRTLDLLHVAAALAANATEFVTSDDRQSKAAAKEGLKVVRF